MLQPDAVARHRVSATKLARYFHHELSKMRHVFTLTFYILCAMILAGLISANRVNFFSSTAQFYYEQRAQQVLQADVFNQATSFQDFFPWLNTALQSASDVSTMGNASTKFMELVELRQLRMSHQNCTELQSINGMDSLSQQVLNVYPCVGDPQDEPPFYFGDGNAFPLRSLTNMSGRTLTANFHNLGDAFMEYVAPIRIATLDSALQSTSAIELNGWIDDFTSCLCADVVAFFGDGTVVFSSFIMERTTTGMFSIQIICTAFTYFDSHHELISLDAVAFCLAMILFFFLCVDVHEKYIRQVLKVNPSKISRVKRFASCAGPWEFISVALIGCIVSVTGMRFRLWALGTNINQSEPVAAFNAAVSAVSDYEVIYTVYCAALVLVAFRVLYSFRYVSGLSKITNALRRTRSELARLGVLFIVLLFVFTISGSLLFAESLAGMRTFPNALAYLIIAIVSASIDPGDYNVMRQSKGALTDLFIMLLFLIFWMIMINLLVAIVSSAFLFEWADEIDTDSVVLLARKYVSFTQLDDYAVDRLAKEGGDVVTSFAPSKKFAHHNLRLLPNLKTRFAILLELRSWRIACYLTLAKKALAGPYDFSLDEAIAFCAVHDSILTSAHLNAPHLIYRLFAYDMKTSGELMSSVQEANELQTRLLRRTLALEAIIRTATGGSRSRSHNQDSKRAPSAPSPPPPLGRTLDEEDVGQEHLQQVRRARAATLVAPPSFEPAGPVIDSDSSVESEGDDLLLALGTERYTHGASAPAPKRESMRRKKSVQFRDALADEGTEVSVPFKQQQKPSEEPLLVVDVVPSSTTARAAAQVPFLPTWAPSPSVDPLVSSSVSPSSSSPLNPPLPPSHGVFQSAGQHPTLGKEVMPGSPVESSTSPTPGSHPSFAPPPTQSSIFQLLVADDLIGDEDAYKPYSQTKPFVEPPSPSASCNAALEELLDAVQNASNMVSSPAVFALTQQSDSHVAFQAALDDLLLLDVAGGTRVGPKDGTVARFVPDPADPRLQELIDSL